MTLPERLRQETRPQHEQTEQLLYLDDLRSGTLSPAAYRHLLRTHYLFHASLERAIDRNPDFFADYQPALRRKTPWLTADLAHLNEPLPAEEPDFFADWSALALLGAAYVGEGSMLGGTLVWKLLQQNANLQPLLTHARFYQGYGPETGRNWRAFQALLNQQADGQADAIVEGAQQAFALYGTMFEQAQLATATPDRPSVPAKTT